MAAKFLPYLLAGISVGGQYALIAIGYTMVYGILRLINFAHGDIFTVAGFLMVYATASLPLTISIPLVVVATVLLGIAVEKIAYKPLRTAPRMSVIGSMMYFSNYTAVTPTVGAMPGLKAFVAAVFGGIGSIPGAVIGGFIIGICESLIKGAGATTFSDAFTFALLIVVLAVKPTGLFSENLTEKV